MTDMTGGELLARALANEGVKFVFGLPCPEIDPLLAALDANGIRLAEADLAAAPTTPPAVQIEFAVS